MNEDVRIRIIAEAITDAAVKSLHDLTRAEKELIGSVDSAKNALKSESDELNKQAGIIGNLEDKLTDLKLARKRSLDLDEIKKYNKEIASTEQEITKLTGSTQKSASAFQNLGKMLIGFIAVDKLIDMGKSLLTMTIETDRLQAAMRNAVESSEDYAKSLAFLNKLSDDYGQNVNVLTKSYTSFIASSKSSNLSLEERQRIYASVVKAGSALKLSNDSIEGSLTALSQMFSKGNVQAEELRGQLGERLPGAFDMAAKAMGVSTMELNKMLEKGEVLAVDLLPKLATELENTYGDKAKSNLETVGGAWNRLVNQVIIYSNKANEATGFTKGIAAVFNTVADNFGKFLDLLSPGIEMWKDFFSVVEMVTDGLSWLTGGLVKSISFMEILSTTFKVATSIIATISTAFRVLFMTIETVVDGFNALYNGAKLAFTLLKGDMDGAAQQTEKFALSWSNFKKNITQNLNGIGDVYRKIWGGATKEMAKTEVGAESLSTTIAKTEAKNTEAVKKGAKEKEKAYEADVKANQKAIDARMKALEKHQKAYLNSIVKGNKEEQKEIKELYEAQKKAASTQMEYLNKVNYLRLVANAKSLKDLQDAEKQFNADQLREQMRAADMRIKEVQAEIKQLETLDKVRGTDTKAQRTKLYTELEKLQKEYNAASIAVGKQYFTEREAELKKLEDREKLNADIIFEAKRDGLDAQLIAQKNFGTSLERLTDEQLDALILYLDAERKALDKQKQWREWTIQDTFAAVNAIADAALRVFNEAIDEKLERANTSTERALLENKRMWTNWAAQIGNVAQAWTKSMADGIVATVSWAAQGIANLFTASKRKAKAELEDLKAYYDTILSDWRDFMTENGDDIESLYNTLLKVQRTAVEYNRELSQYDPKFIIENELARARQINETYNLALSREQEWFDKQIKHVNDVYNAEVKRINDVYDLQQRLADQQFGAASNAIRMAQAQSLLGLITNEESKESIANEYSSRLAEIQNIFSLADKQIIEGMGAAEIEAINAAKEAREEAIAALNNWYIKELEYVAESEGQKRKEYSETEKIRMQAEEDLDLLRHQKTIDDIERNKKKNEELLGQKQLLDYSLAQLEQVHADNIVAINKRKDEAIQASWEIVRDAVIRGYDEMISAAEQAYQKGVLTLEQYKKMIAEVNTLRDAVNANGINIPAERDADYRRWLNENKLVDNDTNRLTYLTNAGNWGNPYKFASGTESVPLGNNPKGIDTVPALLTEGERVLTAEQNKAIGNISNWDLVKLAQLSPVNGIPSFNVDPAHYQLIAEANALRNMGNTMDLMPLLGEIASVKEAIKGLPIQQFNITENGISKTIKKQNSIVEYHQKRYGV